MFYISIRFRVSICPFTFGVMVWVFYTLVAMALLLCTSIIQRCNDRKYTIYLSKKRRYKRISVEQHTHTHMWTNSYSHKYHKHTHRHLRYILESCGHTFSLFFCFQFLDFDKLSIFINKVKQQRDTPVNS